MHKIYKVLFLVFCSISIAAQTGQTQAEKGSSKTFGVDKTIIEEWVNYLSSDAMMGRKNGSPEMKQAAEYIASSFKSSGLKTFKENDGYLQHYYILNTKKGKKDSIPESNVIGYIEGNDPKLKNEYIVITAHFDHIGVGRPVSGDSINNGANDNASGTTAVMAIAKILKTMKAKPGRTIVFAAVSGEELGLRGSRYFAGHTGFPFENIYLDINFEMIGHCSVIGTNKYLITGPAFSNLADILKKYNKNKNWQLIDTVKNLPYLYNASDNASFVNFKRKDNIAYGVPGHTFVLHNGENHLHKPNDEAKYFNFENMNNFIHYMSDVVIYLSNCKTPIVPTNDKYKKLSEFPASGQ